VDNLGSNLDTEAVRMDNEDLKKEIVQLMLEQKLQENTQERKELEEQINGRKKNSS